MTSTKRIRIVIFSALVLAVLLFAACFSVSFAKWHSAASTEVVGEVDTYYKDYIENGTVRSVKVKASFGKAYKNYICVSAAGEVGTRYIVLHTTDIAEEFKDNVFDIEVTRTKANADGSLTSEKTKIESASATGIKASELEGKYIEVNFDADESYCALDFKISTKGFDPAVGFTLNAVTTLSRPTENCTVTFDTDGKATSGTIPAPQTVARGGKVTRPTDPTGYVWESEWSQKHYIFLEWYKDTEYTTEWDFENDTVSGDTTIYAKWSEAVDGNWKVRINNDVYKLNGVGSGGVTIGEAIVKLEANSKVYLYESNKTKPTPITVSKGAGGIADSTTAADYVTATQAGYYKLHFTSDGTTGDLVVADYMAESEVATLDAGVYIHKPFTAVTAADALTVVGYTDVGNTAVGVANVVDFAASDEFTLFKIDADGTAVDLSKIAETAVTPTLDAFDSPYATADTNKKTVTVKNTGKYRVYYAPNGTLEVEPAVGISSTAYGTESGYYAIGSFSDFEVLAANKLASSDMEGVYGAGIAISNGDIYRVAKVEVTGGSIKVTEYINLGDTDSKKVCDVEGGASGIYYDEWTKTVSLTEFDFYRLIVNGTVAPSSVQYRSNIFEKDKAFGSDVKAFAATPDSSSGFYADVPNTYTIASLTVNGGGEINKLSVGSAAFTYEKGKSYRINQTSVGEQPLTSSITKYAAYSINDHTPVVMVETALDGCEHNFETVMTVAKGNILRFTTDGAGGYVGCTDLWIDKSTPCENNALDGNGTQASWHQGTFYDDGITMTIKTAGTYKFYFRHYNGDGTKWCVSAENLTSVSETELGTVKKGVNGTAQKYKHLGTSIAYESAGKIGKVNFTMPEGYKGDDGNPIYNEAELYTLDSKSSANNYIAPGGKFMIYRAGKPVSAVIHHDSTTVNDVYRVTHTASAYDYTINATHGGADITAKVKGKFIIDLSPAGDKISVNFIGGTAATQSETTNSGWYVVGSFSNWKVFSANKMTSTNVEGVYSANLGFAVTSADSSTLYDTYKIVHVSGGNLDWYGVGGSTSSNAKNLTVTSTTFYADEFKKGTSGMFTTDPNTIYRIIFDKSAITWSSFGTPVQIHYWDDNITIGSDKISNWTSTGSWSDWNGKKTMAAVSGTNYYYYDIPVAKYNNQTIKLTGVIILFKDNTSVMQSQNLTPTYAVAHSYKFVYKNWGTSLGAGWDGIHWWAAQS